MNDVELLNELLRSSQQTNELLQDSLLSLQQTNTMLQFALGCLAGILVLLILYKLLVLFF